MAVATGGVKGFLTRKFFGIPAWGIMAGVGVLGFVYLKARGAGDDAGGEDALGAGGGGAGSGLPYAFADGGMFGEPGHPTGQKKKKKKKKKKVGGSGTALADIGHELVGHGPSYGSSPPAPKPKKKKKKKVVLAGGGHAYQVM